MRKFVTFVIVFVDGGSLWKLEFEKRREICVMEEYV